MVRATPRYLLAAAAAALTALAIVLLLLSNAGATHGGADAMSIDMDPFATPANTVTDPDGPGGVAGTSSLGSNETCAEVVFNGMLDADEDVTADEIIVDVTITNVPPPGILGFQYTFNYPAGTLRVKAKNSNGMLSTAPDYNGLDVSDGTSSDGSYLGSVGDIGFGSPRPTGSGFLQRLTLDKGASPVAMVHDLTLTGNAHVDENNASFAPHVTNNAKIAVSVPPTTVSCPTAETPTPVPPTPTPVPPTPVPQADVKVTNVAVSAPSTAARTVNFDVSVTGILHNNGPASSVAVSATFTLGPPPDCTITPNSTQTQAATLTSSNPVAITKTWTVNCTQTSSHQFSGSVSATVTSAGVTDPNPADNTNSGTGTTAVTGTADLKVTGVTVTSPPTATTGTPFNVSTTASIHNNGPVTPVMADVSLTLTLPTGCDLTSGQNPVVGQDLTFNMSAASNVSYNQWNVTCSTPDMKTFGVTAQLTIDQQHVSESNPANNTGSGSDTTDVQTPATPTPTPPTPSPAPPTPSPTPSPIPVQFHDAAAIRIGGTRGPSVSMFARCVRLGIAMCEVTQTHKLVVQNRSDHGDMIMTKYEVNDFPASCTVNGMAGASIEAFMETSSYAAGERKQFEVSITYGCPTSERAALTGDMFMLSLHVDHVGDADDVPGNNTEMKTKTLR